MPSDISGYNGAVTMPAAHGGDAVSFTLSSTMASKDVSRYGGDRFSRIRGGSLTLNGNIVIFFRKDGANTSPGFVDQAADGAALTLTAEVGCTFIGMALFLKGNMSHAFADPAIGGSWDFSFTGSVAEAWDEAAT